MDDRVKSKLWLGMVLIVACHSSRTLLADEPRVIVVSDQYQANRAVTRSVADSRHFTPVNYWNRNPCRDPFVELSESMTPPRSPLGRHSSRGCLRENHEHIKGWFYYLAGHGPVIWVRN